MCYILQVSNKQHRIAFDKWHPLIPREARRLYCPRETTMLWKPEKQKLGAVPQKSHSPSGKMLYCAQAPIPLRFRVWRPGSLSRLFPLGEHSRPEEANVPYCVDKYSIRFSVTPSKLHLPKNSQGFGFPGLLWHVVPFSCPIVLTA